VVHLFRRFAIAMSAPFNSGLPLSVCGEPFSDLVARVLPIRLVRKVLVPAQGAAPVPIVAELLQWKVARQLPYGRGSAP